MKCLPCSACHAVLASAPSVSVSSLPTTELYQVSGSERRTAELRRTKARLKTQLLAGELVLQDPAQDSNPGAGPLSQLGVTGDFSSLLSSPTRATNQPSDDVDDDVR